jgi:hypothetical protein
MSKSSFICINLKNNKKRHFYLVFIWSSRLHALNAAAVDGACAPGGGGGGELAGAREEADVGCAE